MSIKTHILLESEGLVPYQELIKRYSVAIIHTVSQQLKLPNLDIVFSDNSRGVIPEIGVGGYAPTPHLIFIYINPKHPNLEKTLSLEVECTLAHELHHSARSYTVGYGTTLLEALISEGLADHFEIETTGVSPRQWSVAFSGAKLTDWNEKAKLEYKNTNYNHSDWFYGSKEKGIPRWIGYSIGFNLVGEYMKKNNKKSSELVNLQAEKFV